MKTRLILFCIFLLFSLAGGLTAAVQASPLIQDDGPQTTITATLAQVVPKREIPGDTSVLFIAAVGLVIIVAVGVLWGSRKQS